ALHVDGGGVSDIVFAVMHLLGLSFEPRIPRLSDRKLADSDEAACQRRSKIRPLGGAKPGHLWHAHETAGWA
ncbi:Tn3 family transposase, partial [Aurantimonas sp. C2-6-R+9]|nr:Tn3 family transposase [Aurantimonas sp. C2-6-R+9]